MEPWGFPGGVVVKNPPANAGDTGSIPGSGRCPRGGNGNPLQYSGLGNPMGRGARQATARGVMKSRDMIKHADTWWNPNRGWPHLGWGSRRTGLSLQDRSSQETRFLRKQWQTKGPGCLHAPATQKCVSAELDPHAPLCHQGIIFKEQLFSTH